MLGLEGIKGSLPEGADADLVIFNNIDGRLIVDEVWKFGTRRGHSAVSPFCEQFLSRIIL
jgi:imidazolonepropionase-like amidohydrolase